MGFGHRVYKNYDPRAKLMQRNLQRGAGRVGARRTIRCSSWPRRWRRIALEDDYFVQPQAVPQRRLLLGHRAEAPSASRSIAVHRRIFALARTVGWIAQLNEMISDPEYKIGRPRQLFTGSPKRDVKPIDQR
jgi:citrate synthase